MCQGNDKKSIADAIDREEMVVNVVFEILTLVREELKKHQR
jgi:hypothetical protein